MEFAALTPEQIDALEGPQREAWYAHRQGDDEKAAAILAAYPPAFTSPAPAAPNLAELRDGEQVATPAKPRKRTAKKAPAKGA